MKVIFGEMTSLSTPPENSYEKLLRDYNILDKSHIIERKHIRKAEPAFYSTVMMICKTNSL